LSATSRLSALALIAMFIVPVTGLADSYSAASPVEKFENIPDVRDEQTRAKFHRGALVTVPIPTSSPTLGSGLVVVSPRWGAVAFGGIGVSGKSVSASGENETVPSIGLGLRSMVLQQQRINMRLDFALSKGSEAVYLSAGEAF
jgi:hypothetical protein